MKTVIINCTPHEITVKTPCHGGIDLHEHEIYCGCHNGEGLTQTFPPCGIVPRVSTMEKYEGDLMGIDCISQETGNVTGLPDPVKNTFFIVSGMVFAATDREDVIAPDTGRTAIRNEGGQIVGVTRFIRKPRKF